VLLPIAGLVRCGSEGVRLQRFTCAAEHHRVAEGTTSQQKFTSDHREVWRLQLTLARRAFRAGSSLSVRGYRQPDDVASHSELSTAHWCVERL